MNHRSWGLCFVLEFAAIFIATGVGHAQRATKGDAELMVLDLKGNRVPSSMMKVRDFEGRALVADAQSDGVLEFRAVGPEIWLDFGLRGPKAQPVKISLIDAPRVFVSVRVDPFTARVKEVIQKPVLPEVDHRDRVRGFPGNGQGRLVPPVNDNCANATPILNGSSAFTTVDATTDGVAPTDCGIPSNISNDVWFDYQATSTGVVTVETCGTATFDTKIAIYFGTACTPGSPIGCNDDASGCPSFTTRARAFVVAGNHYLIRLGSFNPANRGTGTITVTPPAAPGLFDHCATAPTVACNSAMMFDNSGGTTDPSDPVFSCRFGGIAQGFGTSWFRFVATETQATISTSGSTTVDTLLAVYSGTCGGLVELGCNDDISINPNALDLLSTLTVGQLEVGDTYYIQVANRTPVDLGASFLSVTCTAPQGDHCDDPLIAVCGDMLHVNLANMSVDLADPDFPCRFGSATQGAGTAWIQFTAMQSSLFVHTNASRGTNDTLLALYEGTCAALTPLVCSEDEGNGLLSQICYNGLQVGSTYYIEVAAYAPVSLGEAIVTFDCGTSCVPSNDDCEDAIELTVPAPGGLTSATFDTEGAMSDIVNPPLSCGFNTGPFRNVWYKVIGTGRMIEASTCNAATNVDTKISVFCGTCLARDCVGGSIGDAACVPADRATFSWCSRPGIPYWVTVGADGSGAAGVGTIQLDITDAGNPACVPTVACSSGFAMGACCLPNGTCVETPNQADCTNLGGIYQGDDTECLVNPVASGGLEGGSFSGDWAESSTNFGTPLCDGSCGFGGGTGPRTGLFWAWFGGIPGFEEGSLAQQVTIPVGATMLEFYLEIPVASGNGTDFLEVTIDGMQVFEAREGDGPFVGYQLFSIPLAGFADGGEHHLEFHSVCTGLTNFFVDDISIDALVPICPPLGACCLPNGSCVTVPEVDCMTAAGLYRGDGTFCVANAVTEGGFEDGPNAPSWVESSTLFGTPVCSLALCGAGGGTGPRTGTYWAFFGGTALADEAAVQQSLTIPAGAATLDFYLEVPATSGNPNDFLEVTIDGLQVYQVRGNSAPFLGYQLVSIPLGAFANNGVHVLRFHAKTSQPRSLVPPSNTTFFVDDVSIGSCP